MKTALAGCPEALAVLLLAQFISRIHTQVPNTTLFGCLGNQFACNSGQCVKQEFLCNGVTNCDDGSDEEVCNQKVCPNNQWACPNAERCIPITSVCNGKTDCDDGADEVSACSSRRCGLLSCLYRCNPSPEGGMCYCAEGMALKPDDQRTCIDFNECSSWGYCDQYCTDKQNGYTCSCHEGFTLIGKQICQANNSEKARIIVSSNKRIFSMKTDSSDVKLIATSSSSPVAFDSHRDKIFWSSGYKSDKHEFWESDSSGENKRLIPLKILFMYVSLVYDWIGNNLYYSDKAAGNIGIFNLDTRRQCNIITSGLTQRISMAIDPLVGYMFLAFRLQYYPEISGIHRAFMDGSNMVHLKTSAYIFPQSITTDVISKRIYLIDSHFDQVLTFDYNGLNRFEIIAGGRYIVAPVAIAHFESHLFWCDLNKGVIKKMNKNGSVDTLTEIYHNTSESPRELNIFHSSLQPQGKNPCKQAKCQYLCAVAHTSENNGLGYRCLCQVGFVLDSSRINCTRIDKFVLVTRGRVVKGIPLDRKFSVHADAFPPFINTFTKSSHIRSLDYTASDRTIYFTDSRNGAVFKFNLNTSELKPIFGTYVHSLSVDWMLRNLYVVNRNGITVLRIDNVNDRRVIISNETTITAIVCHPYKGLIFFASASYMRLSYIARAFADGSNVKYLRRHELGVVYSLSIDFNDDYLYWSDSYFKRIQRSDLDGNNVQTLGLMLKAPTKIFVYGDDLYLLSYLMLAHTKKTGDSPVHKLLQRLKFPRDFKIYDKDLQKIEASNPCIQRNGDCSHFCFAVPMTQDFLSGDLGRHCGCPYGMKLDTDLRTCINHTEFEPPTFCLPNTFQCKNKRCIQHYSVCNQQDDCFDNSDEVNCTSPSRTCMHNQFKCTSGKCIPLRWKCDQFKDCPDNIDEKDCNTNCSSNQFRCNNGYCIYHTRKCNSYTDCVDGSDEGAFCANHTCPPNTFKCDGYKCVYRGYRCNGRRMCRDGSDERNCPDTACSSYQWKCPASNVCLQKRKRCDGRVDCEDGADEANCNATTAEGCREGFFRCLGGSCIPNNWRCDGHKDCESGSDENSTCITKACPGHQFRCKNGLCIPKYWVCDHYNDCGDNSDEGQAQKCPSPKFRCLYGMWECPGGHQICISEAKICDGKSDCPGGTDESPTCNSNSCMVNKGGCAFRCLQTPFGAQCLCPLGQEFASNETCVDLNECEPPGICSQHCQNLEGSYKCSCDTGYQSERNLCLANENTTVASLIAITFNSILNISLDFQTQDEINIADSKRIVASAIDIINQTIYFAENKKKIISKIKTNGSDQTVVVQTGLSFVIGLAVDWIGRNLYWTDSRKRTIEVSDLQGNHRTILLKLNQSRPLAIDIDPRKDFQYLFWTEWQVNPSIHRMDLDGENEIVIVNKKLYWPSGLTIDYPNKRLYFVESRMDYIGFCRYDGSGRRQLFANEHYILHPRGLTIFEDTIYWTDPRTRKLMRCPKFNCNINNLQQTFLRTSLNVMANHPVRQPTGVNPCSSKPCSHLCLQSRATKGYKCTCPAAMKLSQDSETCVNAQDEYLLYAYRHAIKDIDLQNSAPRSSVFGAIFGLRQLFADFDIDRKAGYVYYILDRSWQQTITRIKISGENKTSWPAELFLGEPNSLAIDWTSGNLFWSSTESKTIHAMKMNSNHSIHKIILGNSGKQTDVSFPTSLCLDPSKGLVYWTDKGSYDIPAKIGAVKMDGSDPQILVKDNMQTPGFLTTDPSSTSTLYWSDGQLGKIEKYDTTRSERQVILNGLNFVTGIAVYKGYLYYGQKDMETLSYVSLSALNYGSTTMKQNVYRIGTLKVVYNWNKYSQTTNCAGSNYGNCQQLCLPTGINTHKCDCMMGYKLDSNNQCTIVTSFYAIAQRYGVRGFSFDSEDQNDAMMPIGGVQYVTYIDVLVEEKYIYYVAQYKKGKGLCRIRQNGSDYQELLQSNSERLFVRGIAVDWIAGNLYYVNSIVTDGFIEVCRLNGTYRKVILEDRFISLQSLTVNPIKRYLYWTSRGTNAKLERSLLDGTNRTVLVSSAINQPLDITVDIKTHDVYWVDNVIDAIQRISFSGGNRAYIRTNLPSPYGITVFNDDIFWVDRNLKQVLKVNKNSKVGAPTVVKKNVRYLSDISIFDKANQPGDSSNPCAVNNGGCDQLCFAIAGSSQPVCKCVEGDLDSDGQKCKPLKEFLLMAIESSIQTISLHPNRTDQKITTITATDEVSGVAYDAKGNQIYYGVNNPAAIVRYDLETKTSQQFVIDPVEKLAFIGKLAIDWNGKKIYWTDMLYNRISVMSFDSTYKANLLTTQKPKGIVLDPCKGYMYWSNSGIGQSASIEKSTMAGSQRSVLVSVDLGDPDGLAIDLTYRKLYWADSLKNKIERISLDGQHRDVIIANTYEPKSLTVFGLYIYWTSSYLRSMYRAEKHSGANTVRMTKYFNSVPADVVLFSEDVQSCTFDPCQKFNGGCSQGCHPAPNGEAECSCNGTSLIVSKYKTCVPQDHNCTDTDFICSNGKCIYKSWVCDQDDDCKDGSDENSNLCATHTCEKTQYRCNNGRCINQLFRCDIDDDCLDNSDEIGCDASTCGPAQFTCKNYRCIDAEQVCDGYDQCRDGEQTDEKNCPNNMTCPNNKVKCPNSNICISIHLLCDGDNDCGDNADENVMFCKSTNCTGYFRCLQDNRCIPSHWYCDGTEDCASGEDEATNCHVNLTCASGMFACSSGGCIYNSWLCDGENDCSDGSDETIDCRNIVCAADEFNCTHNRNIGFYPCIKKKFVCDGDKNCLDGEDERQSCPPDICDDNEFLCANGGCILSKFVCDRENDCGDSSDEHSNCEYPECGADLFTCGNNRCILNSWVCDGDNDCHDNTDEKESMCLTPAPTCPPGQFRCDNGECINYMLACNKNPDCSDHTDERHCYINECEDVAVHRCEHTCVDTLTSYHCECNPGYTLMTDRKACRDVNECLEKPGICSQTCHNMVGNYSCKCNEGYMRTLDTHSCKKKDDEIPWLVFGNRHYIRKLTPDGLNYQMVAQDLHELRSLDFDYQEQRLYFMDKWTLSIQRIFVNGSNQEKVVKNLQYGRCTVAVDWVGRKLYWFQWRAYVLFVSELNGTSVHMLNSNSFHYLRFLVAYPPTGYLYFIDALTKAWIGRIGMDGSNYQLLIKDGLGFPTGLAIDFESKRMWWADSHFDAIEYANLDGTNRQTVMKENIPLIHSLAVFEDWIYWTDMNHLSIERAHKFTGHNHTILRNMTHKPSYLIVFHSLRQKQYKNPCGSNNGGCSHLCLHSPPDSYVCACPEFFVLDLDNKTCIANCSTSQFRCGNGDDRCIPFYYRCDKDVDCKDGSDESNCPESQCRPHTFTCNNGNCSSFYKICDSQDDCGDGSDEDRCEENFCAPWLFRCDNNRCVFRSWQCDGYDDCLDNSDEDISRCAKRTCGVNEFTCANGYCVHEEDKCDYENDCFDGSDESAELNCANQTCPETSFRCETNYRCIHSILVCNGYNDCGDNSDEKSSNCRKCDETKEFKCKNNVCIPNTWRCDSHTDCYDGSDEDPTYCKNKYRDCSESEFRCDNQRCILKMWQCNMYDDCGDGSDERCASIVCSEDEFKCDSGHCIDKQLTCDGWRHCKEASDERNCTPRFGDRYCQKDKFQCNNNVCIPKQWVCDSDNDCGDGSDETHQICLSIECSEKKGRFRCDNLVCIPAWRVCDGQDNCGDASDENTHHVCEQKEEICGESQFKCTSKECIDAFKVCNERADCADESDEIGCIKHVGAVNCSIDNGGCQHNCTDLEGGGMICSCQSGFKMKDEKTKECVDINECELSTNKCPQLCTNTKGSYECPCHEGFQDPLLPTPICKYTKGGKVSIFMSVGNGIRRFDPTIKEYMSTLLSVQKSQGLAVDVERSTLYWTDMISKTVMRSYISQKSDNAGIPHDLKLSNLQEPNGISIDWISGNVYWTDSKARTISVAAKDGRYKYTLIKTKLLNPYAIVVNSQTGWMYWTDIHSYNPKIERSWMSGERRQVLVNKELARPTGIAIDYFMNNRVFWSDSKFNRILSMKPDGTDQVVVVGNAINPLSIDLYESEIYWVSQSEGKLMQRDKFGRGINVTLRDQMFSPSSVIAFPPYKYPKINSQCSSEKTCSHLCLLIPNGYRCACPDGSKFIEESTTICDAAYEAPRILPMCICYNGGSCIQGSNGTYICHCKEGYYGNDCSLTSASGLLSALKSTKVTAITVPVVLLLIMGGLTLAGYFLIKKRRLFSSGLFPWRQNEPHDPSGVVAYRDNGNIQIDSPNYENAAEMEIASIENEYSLPDPATPTNFSNPMFGMDTPAKEMKPSKTDEKPPGSPKDKKEAKAKKENLYVTLMTSKALDPTEDTEKDTADLVTRGEH